MPLRSLLTLLLAAGIVQAQEPASEPFVEKAWVQLTDRAVTPLGEEALRIRPGEWKHAETANFVYHYFHSFIAAPVAVEAEFYYRVIAREMEKDTSQWERKSHIFVFETDADWADFRRRGALEAWTGGICASGSLFIQRNPELKFKGSTLGHEVAHLVAYRFFGAGLPRWLSEGHAEYASTRCFAAFNRARGYLARPRSRGVPAEMYLPIAQLTAMMTYPSDPAQVTVFYHESERLVRFLSGIDKRGFNIFFEAMARGNRFESALTKGFGGRFINLDALEREFKTYALQANGTTTSD